MSYPKLYACATVFMLATVGSIWLLAYAMGIDIVSMPDPASIAVEYARPYHVHGVARARLADAEK